MTQAVKRLGQVVLIILLLVVILVFTAPASLIEQPAEKATGNIDLVGIQGQLFNGSVGWLQIEGIRYQNLSWDISPLSLLLGKIASELRLEDPKASLNAKVTVSDIGEWRVDQLNGQMDINPLTQIAPPLGFFNPHGELFYQDVTIALNESLFTEASGRLTWQQAMLNVVGMAYPLGTIAADLSTDGRWLFLDFSGDYGVQPRGRMSLAVDGTYQIRFDIVPEQLPPNTQMLVNLGQMQANGRLQFTMQGRLKR